MHRHEQEHGDEKVTRLVRVRVGVGFRARVGVSVSA